MVSGWCAAACSSLYVWPLQHASAQRTALTAEHLSGCCRAGGATGTDAGDPMCSVSLRELAHLCCGPLLPGMLLCFGLGLLHHRVECCAQPFGHALCMLPRSGHAQPSGENMLPRPRCHNRDICNALKPFHCRAWARGGCRCRHPQPRGRHRGGAGGRIRGAAGCSAAGPDRPRRCKPWCALWDACRPLPLLTAPCILQHVMECSGLRTGHR